MITGDVKNCIVLATLEELKDWLIKNKGIEISIEDIDEYIDQRFDMDDTSYPLPEHINNYHKATGDGYILLRRKYHPNATDSEHISEHRFVMSMSIGRSLRVGEVVHHINGNKSDNRIDNLMLFPTNGAHLTYHGLQKTLDKLYNKI